MIVGFLISIAVQGSSVDIAQNYFLRGSEYAEHENYSQAIAEYNKAVKLEPTYGVYRFALGSAYFQELQ